MATQLISLLRLLRQTPLCLRYSLQRHSADHSSTKVDRHEYDLTLKSIAAITACTAFASITKAIAAVHFA